MTRVYKTIKYIVIISLFSTIAVSCGKDFLDVPVQGKATPDSDPAIAEKLVTGVYNSLLAGSAFGVLAGYNIDSMKVRVHDGSMHSVDSKPIAFELAAKEGFKEAAKKAAPVLLEPIMKLEVTTPDEYTGSVIGDLNRRRGLVKGQDVKFNAVVVKAEVPLSEMFGYVTQLRTITSGRASSSMEFSHFAQAPANIAADVIEKAKGTVKA